MGEVIQFPAPNEVRGAQYTICDDTNEDEICSVHSASAARNIARIMSDEWPDLTFTVVDETSRVLFRVSQDEETVV